MKVVAIIQARSNSNRFPEKIKSKIGNVSLLDRCVYSAKAAKSIDSIVIATTTRKDDQWIKRKYSKDTLVNVFCGDEQDVLSRFMEASKLEQASIIVRLTADDPFKPSWLIDELVPKVKFNNFDYASNTIKPSYPEGLDVEVFTFKALSSANLSAYLPSDREHVTPYIWRNVDKFKCFSQEYKHDLSWARLTIDYSHDLKRLQQVWEILEDKTNSIQLLEILCTNKTLRDLSISDIIRNEGYINSKITELKNLDNG